MKKILWWIFLGIIASIIIVSPLIFLPPIRLGGVEKSNIDVTCDLGQDLSQDRVRRALETWVYDHSVRISHKDAIEIVLEARKTNKALLLLALMEVESNFVTSAISNKGAMGLTQVMPRTWEKHLISKGIIRESRDLFDIPCSVAAGNEVLSIFLKEAKGDVVKALEKYLGGQDGAYTKRILNNLAILYVMVEGLK